LGNRHAGKDASRKERLHRITREAVEAHIAGDFMRLHRARGLMPWECSPLPDEAHGPGVDQVGESPRSPTIHLVDQ
jgi:hypothetical protein